MLFYAVGALIHQVCLLPRMQNQDALMAIIFALGVVLFTVYLVADLGHPLLLITSYRMCIVVSLFVYFSKWLDRPIQRFTTLGVYSLELYVFNYFLIIGCSEYHNSLIDEIKEMPVLFQFMLNAMTAAVITTLTLQIAKVANNNTVVKKYVLGKF